MIIPIRCFTCSKVIADKYDYYHQEKNKLKPVDKKDDPFQSVNVGCCSIS